MDVCVLCRLSNPFTAVTKWDLLVGRLSKTCKQQQQPLILNIKTAKLLITGLLISRHYVFSLNVFSNWTLSQSSFRIHHSECWHDYTLYVAIDDVVSAPYAIGRRLHILSPRNGMAASHGLPEYAAIHRIHEKRTFHSDYIHSHFHCHFHSDYDSLCPMNESKYALSMWSAS